MALYLWVCECGETMEISVPINERDTPPDKCSKCGGNKLTREHVTRPTKGTKGFILEGHSGWHDREYSKHRSLR